MFINTACVLWVFLVVDEFALADSTARSHFDDVVDRVRIAEVNDQTL